MEFIFWENETRMDIESPKMTMKNKFPELIKCDNMILKNIMLFH